MISITEEFERLSEFTDDCPDRKVKHLYDLVVSEKPKLTVEIGSRSGKALAAMALGVYRNGFGKVVGIDKWDDVALLELSEFCRREPYSSVVQLMRRDIMTAVSEFDEETVGVLHAKGLSIPSLDAWVARMKAGGILIIDDASLAPAGFKRLYSNGYTVLRK